MYEMGKVWEQYVKQAYTSGSMNVEVISVRE